MIDTVTKPRKRTRRNFALAVILVVVLMCCGRLYVLKSHRDLNMQLLGAVKKQDAEAVRYLLARGADPNIRDVADIHRSFWEQIQNALHKRNPTAVPGATVIQGNQITIGPGNLIRAKQITVNGRQYTNFVGSTSSGAFVVSEPTILEMVIDSDGENENISILEALLDAGARTEDYSVGRTVPLMTAVSSGKLKTVQTLLDHGANPLARDEEGRIPFECIDRDSPDALNIARLLVAKGSDVNVADSEGTTMLMNYAGWSDVEVVELLVLHGAKVNTRAKNGVSALLLATMANDIEITKFLLDHGGEVNVSGFDKVTPLDYAAAGGPLRLVQMLLAHGAKIDPVDSDGDTPLTSCLQPGHGDRMDIVKTLVAQGADVSHRNKAGETPLSLARKRKYKDVIKLLIEAGAKR